MHDTNSAAIDRRGRFVDEAVDEVRVDVELACDWSKLDR